MNRRNAFFPGWSCLLLLGAASCGPGERPLEVRLQSGPVAAVEALKNGTDRGVRFVYANVISPHRSSVTYAHFSEYLSSKLRRPVVVVRRQTYQEANDLLRTGKAAAGLVCTGAYAVGREQFGLRFIAAPVVHGRTVYFSFIIARRGTQARCLEDLKGTVFAFSDPLSNSGFRFVVDRLHRMGTTPERFFKRTFFTYSHDNTIQAVRDGIARAGAVDSLIWEILLRERPEIGRQLVVVEKSEPFPINPIVASPLAAEDFCRQLREILLSMHEDPAGRAELSLLGVDRFTTIPLKEYDPIVRSWRTVGVLPGEGEEKS